MLESQIPSRSINSGITITVTAWNRNSLKNDRIADTRPLPRAVKNAEPKILKPTIYGPTKQDNGSLDSETGVLITGGNLIAIGPTGMVETPVKNSTQCYISINLPSSQSADTPIKVYDEDENELLNITPQKKYQSVILSLCEFNLNDTYIVEIGSQTYEAKLTSIGTALGTNSMGGGNQGGRPGGPNKPW